VGIWCMIGRGSKSGFRPLFGVRCRLLKNNASIGFSGGVVCLLKACCLCCEGCFFCVIDLASAGIMFFYL
jgi:hypothetical protein